MSTTVTQEHDEWDERERYTPVLVCSDCARCEAEDGWLEEYNPQTGVYEWQCPRCGSYDVA